MKKKRNIIFIVIILLCGIAGGTYAYYSQAATFDNNFKILDFNVVIEENYDTESSFGGSSNITSISKEVFVVNKEDTGAIVRISYNEYIDNASLIDGEYKNIQNNLNNESDIFTKNWTDTFISDWVYSDGWYYYKKILPGNEKTQVLESVTYNDILIDYGVYNLDFNIEAVQPTSDAVLELWNKSVTINSDDTLEWNFR